VKASALLTTGRADRPRTFRQRKRDDVLHAHLRFHHLLTDRNRSYEGEVRRNTEVGHRVLRVSVMGAYTTRFCSTAGPVSTFFYLPATISTKNRI
jgi:hypothetical protein